MRSVVFGYKYTCLLNSFRRFINFLKLLHNGFLTVFNLTNNHGIILAKRQSDFFNVSVPAMFPDYLGIIGLP